jgi:hypothetical protein
MSRAGLPPQVNIWQIGPYILTAPQYLARGLQCQDRHGPGEPRTADLLAWLAGGALSRARARVREFAETVDMTVMLTLSRVTEGLAQRLSCGRP